jgi:hypothetical protein
MTKIEPSDEGGKEKFVIVCGDKIYKFLCETEEKAQQWIEALNSEFKKYNGERKFEQILEVKLKKKVIVDFYKLPNIHLEKANMKKNIEEQMSLENYFPPKKIM